MATAIAVRPILAHRLGRSRRLLAVGAPLIFFALQFSMALHTLDVSRTEELAQHTYLDPYLQYLVGGVGSDVLAFAGFALAGALLARLGYRVLWTAPVLIGVYGYAIAAPHLPQPLGFGWFLGDPGPHWYGNGWAGGTVDIALCLAAGLPFLSVERRRPRGRPSTADLLWVLAVAMVVAITLRTAWVITTFVPPPPVLAAVGVFALLAGTARPWPWAVTGIALAVGGTLGAILWILLPPLPGSSPALPISHQVVSTLLEASPLVICVLTISLWERLGALMRASTRRPLWLLVAVNALNLADALLTQLAVRAGAAVELNLVVRLIGVPAKLVLVGLLSWFLYRRRPATLLIPAAVLLVMLAYHVSGLVIDG
jgi:hypothetical protein